MRRLLLLSSTILLLASSVALTAQTIPAAPAVPAALSATRFVVGIIPVAVSSPGQESSFFRTAVQAYNGTLAPISGAFVFRPQGQTSAAGPSLPFSIDPGQTIVVDDLLSAMGQSGIGSIDVTTTDVSAVPVLSVRVFNDAGSAGTTGFSENMKRPEDVLGIGSEVVLVAPADPAAFRFNIGLRTFGSGASIKLTTRDQQGNVRATFTRDYPANDFEQMDAASFLGGLSVGANDTMTLDVTAGGLILYGVSADNRTNDPAMQEPQPVVTVTPPGTPQF